MGLSAYRAHVALLVLLTMLAPLGLERAMAAPMHHEHHEAGGARIDQAVSAAHHAHDHLSCSIVVPCDHGYCAGVTPPVIESLPEASPQLRFETAGAAKITVHAKPEAPPPRRRS